VKKKISGKKRRNNSMCCTEHLVPCICTGEVPVNLDLATVYPDALLLDRGSKSCRNPCTDLERPRGFQELEAPRFPDSRQMKVVSLSSLAAAAFIPRKYSCTHFCWRLSRPQGHSAAGRLLSMKNRESNLRVQRVAHCLNQLRHCACFLFDRL